MNKLLYMLLFFVSTLNSQIKDTTVTLPASDLRKVAGYIMYLERSDSIKSVTIDYQDSLIFKYEKYRLIDSVKLYEKDLMIASISKDFSECNKELNSYKNPPWYKTPTAYATYGAVVVLIVDILFRR